MGHEKSGQLALALHAVRSGRIESAREAAKIYDVAKSTLSDTLRPKPLPRQPPQSLTKLTQQED